ncbi:MAG TPA: hypothetical protein VMM80_07690, partial [Bacteroidota bacterium]|nr:hypothetical protein [Bacteroidota bacterium]
MTDPNIVVNLKDALLKRQFPSITRWNRLEGRPRTHDFDRALRAEVRDALWMLTRQWQMGEFQGDDAGSPLLARACIDISWVDRFQEGKSPATPLTLDQPLEAIVERRPLPLRSGDQYLSLDLRLVVARRWMKLLAREAARPGGLSADYRGAYLGQYPVNVPDPTLKTDALVCAHTGAWQMAGSAAGRLMDGIALLEHIALPGGAATDGIAVAGGDGPKLNSLASHLRDWFQSLILQPGSPAGDAWVPERLEYQFGISAQDGVSLPDGGEEIVMRAEGYYQGRLDWYALERDPAESRLGTPPMPMKKPERIVQTFIPGSVVFDGMPDTRWWAFEDRRTNFGDVKPDTTDLGKLLLLEFALVYANDWFTFPLGLPVGTLSEVKGIAVTNVFNERLWITPLRDAPAADWETWGMYTLTPSAAEKSPSPSRLLLLPAVVSALEGAPVEQISVIRDEMANMVWGIEQRVPLPSGESRPGAETGRELHDFLQSLIPPAGPPPAPVAPIRYQVMNSVPEEWIPFIPVRVENDVREIQLQRGAMPRILEGDT